MKTYMTRVHGVQVAVLRQNNKLSYFFKTLRLAREFAKQMHPNGGYVIALTQVASGTTVYKD